MLYAIATGQMALPHQAPCRRKCTQQAHSSYANSGEKKKNAFKIYTYGLMNIYMFVTWALPSIKKLGNSSLRHDFLIFAPFKD